MKAMVLHSPKSALRLENIPIPIPNENQILIKVHVCGICRTDLHIVDGELKDPHYPIILGHQIVGTITVLGKKVKGLKIGDRVGIPWLGGSCGKCEYCKSDRENLCDNAIYTGYRVNGGFAEYCVADARFCFKIPNGFSDLHAAPLLCAGLIGYRSYKMTGEAKKIGFYGFGAAAHLLIQLAIFQKKELYAFTRKGDSEAQSLARELGASWAGSSDENPPVPLDAAIIFAPVGALIPKALSDLKKGGKVVCAGIHMSNIPAFPYSLLYGERSIISVTNLTRQDGEEFLALAQQIPIKTKVTAYPLERANEALSDLHIGKIVGSAVIVI